MRKIFVTVFILFSCFFETALAGRRGDSLLRSLKRAVRQLEDDREIKMMESLQELEKRFWGKSFGDISIYDVRNLRSIDFDLEDIMRRMENDRERFRSRPEPPSEDELDEITKINTFGVVFMEGYIHSSFFLRWWDHAEDFREYVFTRIDKRHLSGNHGLLLRWWDEIKIRAKENQMQEEMLAAIWRDETEVRVRENDQLVRYIRTSFENVIGERPFDFDQALDKDAFLHTVFRAMDENESFADDMEPVFERLFREFNIGDDVDDNGVRNATG